MDTRLIDVAFPMAQASIDSVHEKNVRHGHISTLHIWPARRPLAACRAALIATLLPDPGAPEERAGLVEKIGGTVVHREKGKGEITGKAETKGGVLHWGRENSPDMDWFREKIREAYGGRAPRVLDPFAGGGAIPLEAMRLGCEVTAADINPVAWFILKCTLEYPQKLAGQTRPLPAFALQSEEFMAEYRKAHQAAGAAQGRGKAATAQASLFGEDAVVEAGLAWHVRAWGWWVLQRARADLERYYPTIDGKPTVAYLWARTVACKNCRATIPLLKTRWLCKKENKRVALTMTPNEDRKGVTFGIWQNVPVEGGNNAQRRARDREFGGGTMSRSGATCPCCGSVMTMEDIRLEARAGRMATVMTAVVVDGAHGKEYRLPQEREIDTASAAATALPGLYAQIPFGLPTEPLPSKEALGFRVPLYGMDQWGKLFTPRQLLALGTFVLHTRAARKPMVGEGYPLEWVQAINAYLAVAIDKLADYASSSCTWAASAEMMGHTFVRFALPITWDFTEVAASHDVGGAFEAQLDWVARVVDSSLLAAAAPSEPSVEIASAAASSFRPYSLDVVVTDPPYYDAIPYSDLMDFFYVWLRRILHGLSPEIDGAFAEPLAPKWDHKTGDGELIDDASRFGGDKEKSKAAYEDGMFRSFQACDRSLAPDGRLVIVFAHKQPDAWETLVSAIIRAGFTVDASWPIRTEREARTRALASAALSSSVWLVCKKRPVTARPGWDNRVLEEMREILHGTRDESGHWTRPSRLHEYWDAGIRGPDFVWAATGPALEAYSRHPVVRKANEPGAAMSVSEFLRHVRRLVVDFVVGRVLGAQDVAEGDAGLDDVTTYYLLHRHDFGLESAPAGACILYAVSCNLSDRALVDSWDLLARSGGSVAADEDDESDDQEDGEGSSAPASGSELKIKPWSQRQRKTLGEIVPGRIAPLIDQAHHLMHLWKAGDVNAVDNYVREAGLRRHRLFPHLLQALIELAPEASEERAILESISNHLVGQGVIVAVQHSLFAGAEPALAGIEE